MSPKKPAKKAAKKGKKVVKKVVKKKVVKKSSKKKIVKRITKPTKVKKITKKTTKPKKVAKKGKKVVKKVVKKSSKKKTAKKPTPKKITKKPKKEIRKELEKKLLISVSTPQPKKNIDYPVLEGANITRIEVAKDILKEMKKKHLITDWKINALSVNRANIYTGKEFEIENQLTAYREDVTVTIYKRHKNNTMGDAQIQITSHLKRDIRQALNKALPVCEVANRKAFQLPEPVADIEFPEGHDKEMWNLFQTDNSLEVPQTILGKAKKAKLQEAHISQFEVLTSASTHRILNSEGIDISFKKTAVYIEAAIQSGDQEFYTSRSGVSPVQFDTTEILEDAALRAKDADSSKKVEPFKGDVLLTNESLVQFMAKGDDINPIFIHALARCELLGMSRLTKGEPIGEFTGEYPTIMINPNLPLGLMTAPVDDDGTHLKNYTLFRNGVFRRHIAPAREAQELGVEATGQISNIHIQDGATREEHLRGGNYIEIVSFSWFHPDPYSGDFSAEIRLGYKWYMGKKTPFRGGFFVGNIFNSILSVRFSKEIMQEGYYYGPRAMLFKDGEIQ